MTGGCLGHKAINIRVYLHQHNEQSFIFLLLIWVEPLDWFSLPWHRSPLMIGPIYIQYILAITQICYTGCQRSSGETRVPFQAIAITFHSAGNIAYSCQNFSAIFCTPNEANCLLCSSFFTLYFTTNKFCSPFSVSLN